jgi:hypothetical protein
MTTDHSGNEHRTTCQAPRDPTFSFNPDQFQHWWTIEYDWDHGPGDTSWPDLFDNAFDAADQLVSGDGHSSIISTGDWEALAYRQYNDRHCDGLLPMARQSPARCFR